MNNEILDEQVSDIQSTETDVDGKDLSVEETNAIVSDLLPRLRESVLASDGFRSALVGIYSDLVDLVDGNGVSLIRRNFVHFEHGGENYSFRAGKERFFPTRGDEHWRVEKDIEYVWLRRKTKDDHVYNEEHATLELITNSETGEVLKSGMRYIRTDINGPHFSENNVEVRDNVQEMLKAFQEE